MDRSRAASAAALAGPREPGTPAAEAQPSSVNWDDWRWQMRSRISRWRSWGATCT